MDSHGEGYKKIPQKLEKHTILISLIKGFLYQFSIILFDKEQHRNVLFHTLSAAKVFVLLLFTYALDSQLSRNF